MERENNMKMRKCEINIAIVHAKSCKSDKESKIIYYVNKDISIHVPLLIQNPFKTEKNPITLSFLLYMTHKHTHTLIGTTRLNINIQYN